MTDLAAKSAVTATMREAACRALNERGQGNAITIADVNAMLAAALAAPQELVTHIRPAHDGDPICYAWRVCASGDEGALPVYGADPFIFAQTPTPVSHVRVKPLKWEDLGYGFLRAPAPLLGSIRVEHYGDDYSVSYSLPGYSNTFVDGEFSTLEEAKTAAECEYIRRMSRALAEEVVDV